MCQTALLSVKVDFAPITTWLPTYLPLQSLNAVGFKAISPVPVQKSGDAFCYQINDMRLTTFLTTKWGRDGRSPRNRFVASFGGTDNTSFTLRTLLTPPSAACMEQDKSFPLPRSGVDTTDPTDG